MPFTFLLVHSIFPTLMALRFDFEYSTLRIAVLFLTSNMLVNKHSDFLELFLEFCLGYTKTRTDISDFLWSRNHFSLNNILTFFVGHHTYQHVDISFLYYSKNCAQNNPCCALIDQYQ